LYAKFVSITCLTDLKEKKKTKKKEKAGGARRDFSIREEARW
jgi:hypothetical protein